MFSHRHLRLEQTAQEIVGLVGGKPTYKKIPQDSYVASWGEGFAIRFEDTKSLDSNPSFAVIISDSTAPSLVKAAALLVAITEKKADLTWVGKALAAAAKTKTDQSLSFRLKNQVIRVRIANFRGASLIYIHRDFFSLNAVAKENQKDR